ncbi:probable serine/threonine-protein kinase kinX [Mya arenaria]|uniref:probable serine/threonine-protein kinase kinX n=1 Tax=Mya arenaria TaxID=6604 RepID=UPI0022E70CFD|nr:probable serine/threonine-protein kinase kinX [Mya arenaria]XP_052777085.1 probable serine/threonine-protein kinase kinX [Mya arenaria]XP_052777086.1 probable serine/threonine-protein kinase kinX [Mya arenaria]
MSAAKMVADSTQNDHLEERSGRKRRKVVPKKKVKKRKETGKKRRRSTSDEEYDSSDLDLDREILPLGHYVKDRDALLGQMFHCVHGASLKRNLPDVLKELPLDDLKKRCLEQLEVMSKKRIHRIIAGDDPAGISSSGTEDETSEEELDQDLEDGDFNEAGPVADDSTLQDTGVGAVSSAVGSEAGSSGMGTDSEGEEEQQADSTSLYDHKLEDTDREWEEDSAASQSDQHCVDSDNNDREEDDMERDYDDGASSQEVDPDNDDEYSRDSKTSVDIFETESKHAEHAKPKRKKEKRIRVRTVEEMEEGELGDSEYDTDSESGSDLEKEKVDSGTKVCIKDAEKEKNVTELKERIIDPEGAKSGVELKELSNDVEGVKIESEQIISSSSADEIKAGTKLKERTEDAEKAECETEVKDRTNALVKTGAGTIIEDIAGNKSDNNVQEKSNLPGTQAAQGNNVDERWNGVESVVTALVQSKCKDKEPNLSTEKDLAKEKSESIHSQETKKIDLVEVIIKNSKDTKDRDDKEVVEGKIQQCVKICVNESENNELEAVNLTAKSITDRKESIDTLAQEVSDTSSNHDEGKLDKAGNTLNKEDASERKHGKNTDAGKKESLEIITVRVGDKREVQLGQTHDGKGKRKVTVVDESKGENIKRKRKVEVVKETEQPETLVEKKVLKVKKSISKDIPDNIEIETKVEIKKCMAGTSAQGTASAKSSDEGSDSHSHDSTDSNSSGPDAADTSISDQIVKEVKQAQKVQKTQRRIVKPPSQAVAPALTKNQMELLELEMRARAIKAMLKKSAK